MKQNEISNDVLGLSVDLTIAWVSNPATRATADEIVAFLNSSHAAISALSGSSEPVVVEEEGPVKGAVSERASLASKDHIVSMIDGKKYRALRRHIKANGMTPDEYRRRFGLKHDYPMVAASYSEQRSQMAKSSGLGRKPGTKVSKASRASVDAG